ncbi:MAG TPA: VOC family protein [bacterium]|nr:VOC family protein [bacterium]
MLPLRTINQVALVVEDLDAAVRRYWERLGIGPWRIYTYQPPLVKDMTYRGRPHEYRMRLAIAYAGDVMVELIQPLSDENVYTEHLRQKGPGLHHVGVFVPLLRDAVADATRAGYQVLQSGRGYGLHGDGGYAYLDTQDLFGMIVELIELPKERVEPEAVYPPPAPRGGGAPA